MENCDARRWRLPQVVLQHFSPAVLRRSVVWQPAGGGFLMRSSRPPVGLKQTVTLRTQPATLCTQPYS